MAASSACGSAWGDWVLYTTSPLRAFENELGVQDPVRFWGPAGFTQDGSVANFKRHQYARAQGYATGTPGPRQGYARAVPQGYARAVPGLCQGRAPGLCQGHARAMPPVCQGYATGMPGPRHQYAA